MGLSFNPFFIMEYNITNEGILVKKDDFFNPLDTVSCGQLFRYTVDEGGISVFSKDKACKIIDLEDAYLVKTKEPNYFVNYLDFDRNYDIIYKKLIDKGAIEQSCDYSKGVRILNQDPYETIISFIISANNNIPRIQKIIGRLCESLGEDKGGFFAFPTADAMASKDEAFYASLGAGYRASYIASTARALVDVDLESYRGYDTDTLLTELLKLKGVGPKVADCIALFGYHKEDVFPVDTWIKKVYNQYFGCSNDAKFIRKDLVNKFQGLSGYMQQYLFYYKRELDKIDK